MAVTLTLLVGPAPLAWSEPTDGDGSSGAAPQVPVPAPTTWPLPTPHPVLRGYDPPDQPWLPGHRGVDLGGRAGEPVAAVAAGTVSFAGSVAGIGVAVVDHGATRTTYEPVRAAVPAGTRVTAGQQIATLLAGHCATACLHLGWKAGDTYLDPMRLLAAGGPVRLLPASAVAPAQERAARQEPSGSGRHGLLLPVQGPITSPYGMRLHPIRHIWELHDGTDLGAECGTPIRAPADAVVTRVVADPAYGNRMFLDLGRIDGHAIVIVLNHAEGYAFAPGDRVAKGQPVGWVGQTGYATGCHLHLMVLVDGATVDPMAWW